MYQNDQMDRLLRRSSAGTRRVDYQPRPRGTDGRVMMETPHPVNPMPVSPRMPLPRWSGAWNPHIRTKSQSMGALSDDIPTTPGVVAQVDAPSWFTPVQATAPSSTGGNWLSNLFGGLASIITPAAQALVATKATGYVQQQQQKTLAQTYNPTLTGPAINAQTWQAAYTSGSGAAPLGLSMGTLGLIAAGSLALYLIVKK